MKGILILLLAGAAAPALAQQSAQTTPATPAATNACLPEHAAMGHCKLPAPAQPVADPHAGHTMPARQAPASNPDVSRDIAPAPAPVSGAPCLPEHAAMGHCKLPTPANHDTSSAAAPPPASGAACLPEHAAMGHCKLPARTDRSGASPAAPAPGAACLPEHAAMGHCQLPAPAPSAADPHAGHNMQAPGAAPAPPAAPPPPAAFAGPENAADAFYSEAEMAEAREDLIKEHGDIPVYRILFDQLETRIRDGRDGYEWDIQAWYGGDVDKLWLKSEGGGAFGEGVENAEVQALWSHAIDPWFDLQLGVRHDFRPDPERTYLVGGIQGLAPYWFEVEATAFVSNKGEVSARFEGEYDLRLTQALILQPRVEFDLALQDSPDIRVGSGLSTAELGARLRYEFFPKSGPAVIAPYIGVQYERAFGDTARFYRASGESAGGWSFLAGIRTWF